MKTIYDLPLREVVKEASWFSPAVVKTYTPEVVAFYKNQHLIKYNGSYYLGRDLRFTSDKILGAFKKLEPSEVEKEKEKIKSQRHKDRQGSRVRQIDRDDFIEVMKHNNFYNCNLYSDKDYNFILMGDRGVQIPILSYWEEPMYVPSSEEFSGGTVYYSGGYNMFLSIQTYGKPLDDILDWIEAKIKEKKQEEKKIEEEYKIKQKEALQKYAQCSSKQ